MKCEMSGQRTKKGTYPTGAASEEGSTVAVAIAVMAQIVNERMMIVTAKVGSVAKKVKAG